MLPLRTMLMLFALLLAGGAYADTAPKAPYSQTPEEAHAKSEGCESCHTASDAPTMHMSKAVVLGCTDCHGGDAKVMRPPGSNPNVGPVNFESDGLAGHAPAVARNPDPPYRAAMDAATRRVEDGSRRRVFFFQLNAEVFAYDDARQAFSLENPT